MFFDTYSGALTIFFCPSSREVMTETRTMTKTKTKKKRKTKTETMTMTKTKTKKKTQDKTRQDKFLPKEEHA